MPGKLTFRKFSNFLSDFIGVFWTSHRKEQIEFDHHSAQ